MNKEYQELPVNRRWIRWNTGLILLAGLSAMLLMGCYSRSGTASPTPQPTGLVPANVEGVEIQVAATEPPSATLIVFFQLRDACESFYGYSLTRQGDEFRVEVTNLRPDLDCSGSHRTLTTRLPLDTYDIEACKRYVVVVNDSVTYSVLASCPGTP